MTATRWLIGARLRRGWLVMVLLALVVAAGSTGVLAALGAAQRTHTAYGRYLRGAAVGDLQINPSLFTPDIERVIRGLPGVREVSTHDLLNVSEAEGLSGRSSDPASDDAAQIRGSVDGRYLTMDRPVVRSGRLATGTREAIVNVEMARRRGIRIGEAVTMSFIGSAEQLIAEAAGTPPTELAPVGVERVTVVGIATLPDEVLPDGLYPRERMVVSPDVARRFACSPRPVPENGTYEEIAAAVFPNRCAVNYRYYSLRIDGGERGVAAAADAFVRQGAELNARLPDSLKERGIGYELIPRITGTDRARVDRSTQPTVTALVVLGIFAAIVTALGAGIVVARELQRATGDQLDWWRLGMGSRARALAVALPLLLAGAVGFLASIPLGWLLSPLGPIGIVRVLNPHPHRVVAPWAWWGLGATSVVLAVTIAVLARTSSRRVGTLRLPRPDSPTVGRMAGRFSRPEVGVGLRAAFDGARGAGLVVASGALAAAVFITAVVFGASLSNLISTPRSYGWPWDIAVLSNYGYGGLNVEAVDASLNQRHEVSRWAVLAFTNSVAVDGQPVPAMIKIGGGSRLDFTLSRGRLPDAADEVALGATTAKNHHVGVGDTVAISGRGVENRRAKVTGLTVLPALGPFESDKASPGDGMVLPAAMFDPQALGGLAGFVGIDLIRHADRIATLTAIRKDYPAWGATSYTVEHTEAVRPSEILDAADVRAVPLIVGGLLGTAVVVGLALVVAASVRARRRELAILRALGCTSRQLRRSVRVQTAATMLAALVVGVPAGVVLGTTAWRAFASRLAVVLPSSIPVLALVATTAAALVGAVAAASLPATIAGRGQPAAVLRSE